MATDPEPIIASLRQVAAERAAREAEPALRRGVEAVKAYQRERFRNTYADLLADLRHSGATRFFLEELYGPGDHAERDAQFERVVPTVVKLFPHDVADTVRGIAALHALTESLDTAMARQIGAAPCDASRYVRAWQAIARRDERQAQLGLTLQVGEAIDRYTRKPLLRNSLRLMRGPARTAGLGSLQGFLERGFETFREMRGARDFLATIGTRERALLDALFDPQLKVGEATLDRSTHAALAQLP
jgi:hypothetical protein